MRKERLMGKIDTEAKKYFSSAKRFCDLFNFWIYDGENIISPNELQELDPTSIAIPYKGNSRKHVQKYRDLLKFYAAKHDDQAIYLILGLEIESKINYSMPVRAMLYDAMNYTSQVEVITAQRRQDKPKQTYHEYLSGLGKDDRLKPVITIVLNISGEYWDGCKSIHDLLSVRDNRILQFVPDYKLNLLSPDLLAETDFDKFRTSLGAALQFLKHQNDDNMDWLKDQERMKSLDRATADFIQTTTGTNLHLEDDEEVIDMCKAWKNSIDQAKAEGKAEGKAAGRAEGRAEGVAAGEDKLSRLIAHLIEIGKNDEILSATQNAMLRKQLYEKYSII